MKLNPIMVMCFIIGMLAASACARDKHRDGAPEREDSAGEPEPRPALWEPADKAFKGCEGA